MFTVKTRMQAALDGDSKYSTGRPCVHGHPPIRYTSSGICVKCNAENAKKFVKDVNKAKNARASGAFVYPMHPDDHAAALAYCQALDLARGRAPHVPTAPTVAAPFVLPEDIARHRAVLLESHAPKTKVLDYPIK